MDFNAHTGVSDNKFKLGIKGNDPSNFRNLVIHQGYVPSREQAIAYGDAVNKYIYDLIAFYCNNGKSERLIKASASFINEVRPSDFTTSTQLNNLLIYSGGIINRIIEHMPDKYISLSDYLMLNAYERQTYWLN